MPYIDSRVREFVTNVTEVHSSGDLNYLITKILDEYIMQQGLNYDTLNTVIGVLECAKMELYRRVAAEYEDQKRNTNGDVYECRALMDPETPL